MSALFASRFGLKGSRTLEREREVGGGGGAGGRGGHWPLRYLSRLDTVGGIGVLTSLVSAIAPKAFRGAIFPVLSR